MTDRGGKRAALSRDPLIAAIVQRLAGHDSRLDPDRETPRAAVALILRLGQAQLPELLFIRRARHPGDPWSGQVAFPGGRRERGDPDLRATANRETFEETGIDLGSDGSIVGALDEMRPSGARIPQIVVQPYVAVLHRDTELRLSDEVASVFWVPLEVLRTEGSWGDSVVTAHGMEMTRRALHHEGHVIWGITERIVTQLLDLLE